MEISESEFDEKVVYTLRIELLNGKVIIYSVDTGNKQYLIKKLRAKSDGIEETEPLHFVWFETSLSRMVIINIDSIARVTFCFDFALQPEDPHSYFDNFNIVQKETALAEKETKDGEVRLYVIEDEFLPQAIIYHIGKAPDDHYYGNPSIYSALEKGCLAGLNIELEGDIPLRQFINVIDDDGEETFIPLKQIAVMEFDCNLLFDEEDEEFEDPSYDA
ncbi:MAG: hypothetical protein ABI288_08480 [Ginsengibacter sp.]